MGHKTCHAEILDYYIYECDLRGAEPTYNGFEKIKQAHRESSIVRCLVAQTAESRRGR